MISVFSLSSWSKNRSITQGKGWSQRHAPEYRADQPNRPVELRSHLRARANRPPSSVLHIRLSHCFRHCSPGSLWYGKAPQPRKSLRDLHTGGGNRTRTSLRTAAFEAAASTVPPPRQGATQNRSHPWALKLTTGPPPTQYPAASAASRAAPDTPLHFDHH